MLDRLLHHVHILRVDGRSYRLWEIGELVRARAGGFSAPNRGFQALLEWELTTLLGRPKGACRVAAAGVPGGRRKPGHRNTGPVQAADGRVRTYCLSRVCMTAVMGTSSCPPGAA